MTKNQELTTLRNFIQHLGSDSYLGPVLESEFPQIETDIRNDIIPMGIVNSYRDKMREVAYLEERLLQLNATVIDVDRKLAAQRQEVVRLSNSAANALDQAARAAEGLSAYRFTLQNLASNLKGILS